MSDFVDIDGPGVRAKIVDHYSGKRCIFFRPFFVSDTRNISVAGFSRLFRLACDALGTASVIEVSLTKDQKETRAVLEEMGFALDGVSFMATVPQLKAIFGQSKRGLRESDVIRRFDAARDLASLVEIEIAIHRADRSTRVSFETPESVRSMISYYQRVEQTGEVFVMERDEAIIGFVAFMESKSHESTVTISSVGIAEDFQGQGLFLAMLMGAWEQSRFSEFRNVAGTTTTGRLLSLAGKHELEYSGYLMARVITGV